MSVERIVSSRDPKVQALVLDARRRGLPEHQILLMIPSWERDSGKGREDAVRKKMGLFRRQGHP